MGVILSHLEAFLTSPVYAYSGFGWLFLTFSFICLSSLFMYLPFRGSHTLISDFPLYLFYPRHFIVVPLLFLLALTFRLHRHAPSLSSATGPPFFLLWLCSSHTRARYLPTPSHFSIWVSIFRVSPPHSLLGSRLYSYSNLVSLVFMLAGVELVGL